MPPPEPNPRAASILKNAVAATLDDALLRSVLRVPGQVPGTIRTKPLAVPAPLHVAPHGAAPRNTAPHAHPRPVAKTNPTRPAAGARPVERNAQPLEPIQLTGARLLLEGRSMTEVAAALGVHRYTVTRWKSDPRFQAELRRQVERAALRNTVPHGATPPPRAQNELSGR